MNGSALDEAGLFRRSIWLDFFDDDLAGLFRPGRAAARGRARRRVRLHARELEGERMWTRTRARDSGTPKIVATPSLPDR